MDRFSEKQEKIDQLWSEAAAHFPALWSKIIMEWNTPGTENRVWWLYSANYLLHTNHIRWAIHYH
jgi:hypothetical protein